MVVCTGYPTVLLTASEPTFSKLWVNGSLQKTYDNIIPELYNLKNGSYPPPFITLPVKKISIK
jgi:hypothetical protein